MPRKKVPGRNRLDVKAEPALLDAASRAATATKRTLNGYVVHALEEQMKRDGFEVPTIAAVAPVTEPVPPQPKRPRGRPKKGGA